MFAKFLLMSSALFWVYLEDEIKSFLKWIFSHFFTISKSLATLQIYHSKDKDKLLFICSSNYDFYTPSSRGTIGVEISILLVIKFHRWTGTSSVWTWQLNRFLVYWSREVEFWRAKTFLDRMVIYAFFGGINPNYNAQKVCACEKINNKPHYKHARRLKLIIMHIHT